MKVQQPIYSIFVGAMLTLSIVLIGFGVGVLHLEFVGKTITCLALMSLLLAALLILTRKPGHNIIEVCYDIFLVKDFNVEETVKELVSLAKFLKSLSEHAKAFISYTSRPNEPAKLCITLPSHDQLQTIDVYIKNNFKQLIFVQHKPPTTTIHQNMKSRNTYIVKLSRKILCTYICNLVKDLALVGLHNTTVLDWKGYLKDCNLETSCPYKNNVIDMSFTISIHKRLLILRNAVEKHVLPIIVMALDDIEFLKLTASQKPPTEPTPIIVLCITI